MSQHRQIAWAEKTQRSSVCRESRPASVRSFQEGIHPLLQLHRIAGNRRVAHWVQAKRLTPWGMMTDLQRQPTGGAVGDQYERKADQVACQVMSMRNAVASDSGQRALLSVEHKDQMRQTEPVAVSITPFVRWQMVNKEAVEDKGKPAQRQPETEEEDAEAIQAKSGESLADSFGAGHSPRNLEFTTHELTHVAQPTASAPLQTKRLADTVSGNARPMPSTCSACEVEKKKESVADPMSSMASSVNTAEPFIQRNKIDHGTLTWADFQKEAPKKAKYDAATVSSFEDPDLSAPIPNNAAVDTGEPCKAKGKSLTRFTVDITIDSAQIEVKSFMDQDESWHKPWTTEEPDRRAKCEKELSPKCEKAFKKQFAKIKKIVAKEKTVCQKDFDRKQKEAKKQCKPAEADCKAAFKNGDPSFTINIDGTDITANTKKECAKVLLPDCVTASMQGQEFTQTLDEKSATATNKAECKTRFGPELEKLLKDQITWEATMSGASTTVNKSEECRSTFVDACAADLMQAGSDDLLKHEQTHFDLTDAMAQKAQADLRSLVDSFPTEVDACGQKAAEAKAKKVLASELKKMKKNYAANNKLRKKKQAQYDKETKHGTVEKKQTAWEEKISEGF